MDTRLLEFQFTKEPGEFGESYGKHYEAIGRFVSTFAGIDGHLLEILKARLGVSVEVTRTIYGGKSTPDLTAAIQSLMRLEDKCPTLEAFDDLANEIDDLRIARNSVAHRLMLVKGQEEMAFTDALTKKT
jgi:hypothetical protein